MWNRNTLIDVIYNRNIDDINKYVRMEKEHIARKQERAALRNQRRREKTLKRIAGYENANRYSTS